MDQSAKKVKSSDAYETTVAYFEFLIPGFDPEETTLEFRAIYATERGKAPGAKSIRVAGTLAHHYKQLVRLNTQGYGIFATVNETNGEGVKTENIIGYRTVWADLDDGWPEHLPKEPSLVIETSPGRYQAYWLLRGKMTPAQFKPVMNGIVTKYGGDPKCKDSARVLRVPGFDHTKGEPWRVRFDGDIPATADDYTASELVDAFALEEDEKPRQTNGGKKLTVGKAIGALGGKDGFGGGDNDEITAALDALPIEDFRDRDRWREIVSSVHYGTGGSDEGYGIARAWSEGDPKQFNDGSDFEGLWKSLSLGGSNGDPIKLGTLFAAAKEYGFNPSPAGRLANLDECEVEDDGQDASEYGRSIKTWTDETTQEFFSRMNKEHALTVLGSNVRYLQKYKTPEGWDSTKFLSPEAMQRMYRNICIPVGDKKRTGFDGWDQWQGRRQYKGIGIFPGDMKVPPGYCNLFCGWAREPRKGNWRLFDNHIRRVICDGSDAHHEWLLDWLAHIFQKPDEKPGSAIVLKSPIKGTGKSMVYRFLALILGPHAISVAHANHVVGNFNSHLLQNILLGVEEAFWAGSKTAEGVVKSLITEPTVTIEQKGIDPFSTRNFSRLLINSNNDWTVPAGIDERRFLVLDVKNKRAKDTTYFDPIFAEMEKGGGVEAMLYDLLDRDIRSNLRMPPETDGLRQEREHTLDGVHKWALDVARAGRVYDPSEKSNQPLHDDKKAAIDSAVVRSAAHGYCNQYEKAVIDTRLGRLLTALGVEKQQPSKNGKRAYVYVFPPLGEFRHAVECVARVSATDVVPVSVG